MFGDEICDIVEESGHNLKDVSLLESAVEKRYDVTQTELQKRYPSADKFAKFFGVKSTTTGVKYYNFRVAQHSDEYNAWVSADENHWETIKKKNPKARFAIVN